MDGGSARSRLGSFLLGGLVGGLAGLAASRLRLAPRRAPRRAQPGLRAFEEAPCYRELEERGRHERGRDSTGA